MNTTGTDLAVPVGPSQDPEVAYDVYCRGFTIEEIGRRYQSTPEAIAADIVEMRRRQKIRYPGVSDTEADELRMIAVMIDACVNDKTAAAIRTMNDLTQRRFEIMQTGTERHRQGRSDSEDGTFQPDQD